MSNKKTGFLYRNYALILLILSLFFATVPPFMSISVSDLAKKLDIAPEAVMLHAMDLDFEIPEDETIPDDIAAQIQTAELGDEIAQTEHEVQEQLDREIVDKQQKKTAGQKKVVHKKKLKKEDDDRPEVEMNQEEDGTIILPLEMTVREFSVKIGKPLPIVLVKLKQNGIVASIKDELDYETAAIIAGELDVKVKKEAVELTGAELFRGDLSQMLEDEEPENLRPRPAVISIMGHVDHGKTSVLDFIRKAKVVDGEAGGITQAIGAYQVETAQGLITFLDTPGHEAFTTMRARGAQTTDIAILVVAATEGLKPQSLEAINHAREADIPIIVAINKMDLEGANPDLVKGQLAEKELNPEDWGGDVPCLEVSAKTGKGIDKLLETIHIVAELQELKANPDRNAIATVIESSMDHKTGISVTLLVNTGTLKKGDPFVIYNQSGKIRIMRDYQGQEVLTAGPSTPVRILGLSNLPNVGDILQVTESEKLARKKSEEVGEFANEDELGKRKKNTLATLKARIAESKLSQLKIIIKSDSAGTLEAVLSESEKVKTEDIVTKVIHSGVGEITESDVMLAAAGEAVVVGFNVAMNSRVGKLADTEGVKVFSFDVIYHLTEKLQEILEGKIEETEVEEIIGSMKIKGVFAANKRMVVLGGEVVSGKMRKLCRLRQLREQVNEDSEEKEMIEVVIGQAKVQSVQLGQKEVNEVNEGTECGLKIEHDGLLFEVGDRVELFVPKK